MWSRCGAGVSGSKSILWPESGQDWANNLTNSVGAGHGIVLALIARDADSVDAYRTMDRKFILCYVLKPHWKRLSGALLTASIIGLADLLEPWPIKVVLDYVIGSKKMPQWLSVVVDR